MKKIASGLISLSFLCLLNAGTLAHSSGLKEHINVSEKVYVNGVKIAPGRYTVRYNAESGEMMLSKNGKVVVQAKATVTTNAEKFDHDALLTRDSAKGEELTGIRLGGQREEIHISEMTAEAEPISFMVPDGMCFITEDGFVLTETENGYATAGEK